MHADRQTRSRGKVRQISQSVHRCWLRFGSLKGKASMCTSKGLTTWPLTAGSLIGGGSGIRLPVATEVASSKDQERTSWFWLMPPVAPVKPTQAVPSFRLSSASMSSGTMRSGMPPSKMTASEPGAYSSRIVWTAPSLRSGTKEVAPSELK